MTKIDLEQLARVTGGTVKLPNEPAPTSTGPTFPNPCDPGQGRQPNDCYLGTGRQ